MGPPLPHAKDYPIADELLDDPKALRRLILATAELMPPPKEKKPAKPISSAPNTRPATREKKPHVLFPA